MDAGSRSLTFSHSLPHRTTPQTPGHKFLGRSLRITVPRGFKNTTSRRLLKLEEEKVDMAGKRGRAEFLAAPEMSFSRGDFRVLCLCGSRVRARRRARGGCVREVHFQPPCFLAMYRGRHHALFHEPVHIAMPRLRNCHVEPGFFPLPTTSSSAPRACATRVQCPCCHGPAFCDKDMLHGK